MTKRILVQSEIYKIYDLEGCAFMTIDKGYILFCTKSGLVVKLKANSLGDGIKRLVSYFKDLKKILSKNYAQAELIQEFMRSDILKILEKHEIDLEAL